MDRRDRDHQRKLVGELADRADTILIGTITRVDRASSVLSVDLSVAKVLKGPVQPDSQMTFTVHNELEEWTCSVSGMFMNMPSLPVKDERYLVYVHADQPIRFSRIKRKWPEISAWEETRLIRAQLAKN